MLQINWDSFKTYNQDARGVRYKFEDLCRQLFANEFFTESEKFCHLHANPNNYGLETEPVYDEASKKWIGFQAKFFDGAVDYKQIKHSAEKIVEYYTGAQGRVDVVIFYCNKAIETTANVYRKVVDLLNSSGIEIKLITDLAILDLVRCKYPYLGTYYFDNHIIEQDWLVNHAQRMFDELGERYNQDFNVDTTSELELALFVHEQGAVDYVNKKKQDLCEEIMGIANKAYGHEDYFKALYKAVSKLTDVDLDSICDSIQWEDKINAEIQPYIDTLEKERDKLISKEEEARKLWNSNEQAESEREKSRDDYFELLNKVSRYEYLLELPQMISVSKKEQMLLNGDVLVVSGEAGAGKSQLLASMTDSLLKENRAALLLVAGIYFSENPIQDQIMNNLQLDYSFEDLVDVLEAIGERNNQIVPIFIDALNETWVEGLWKTGLPVIIEKIEKSPMVRLVISYRSGYADFILPNSVKNNIEEGKIVKINHTGFSDNSIEAVKEFLNHYNIPFTPLEYFSYEMTNPLFLTLYCKTYNGEEVSLPELYERLIKHCNSNVHISLEKMLREKGYASDEDLVGPLVIQIADCMLEHDKRFITKEELLNLEFWNQYGLTAPPFIGQLIKEQMLHTFKDFKNNELYYFAYDQMNDYYFADAIVRKCETKEELRSLLASTVLGITDGELTKPQNIELFVNACALYADRFGGECIEVIDSLGVQEKGRIFASYIISYQWRNVENISVEELRKLINKYSCRPGALWSMLIANSMKLHHPLNADFLHSILLGYELNRRDFLWTIYINELAQNDFDRIMQLVEMYNCGESLDLQDKKQIELLLTLFAWLLTSSNRKLRDYTSKAMVEIMKNNFELCKTMLKKFEDVNDPYVIQRLYGIVFGACCKRKSGNLQSLAEYVYENVFNHEKVYPDIILRDYARLIIERFLYEEPNYAGIIKREKIEPPYNSEPIPEIAGRNYLEKEYDGEIGWIIHSMRMSLKGSEAIYGDFGRYIFQSALHGFDVNDEKMFNYAMYHIIEELGYDEKYFGEYDKRHMSSSRYFNAKTERIGKKYQWITMYNMLARISDHCKMLDQWNYPPNDIVHFEGAWDPFVRDFDPTLNVNFMKCNDAPNFEFIEQHVLEGVTDNKSTDISTDDAKKEWLLTIDFFLDRLKDTSVLSDDNDSQWILLTRYCDTGHNNLGGERLLVWSWQYAYFVTAEQAKEIGELARDDQFALVHEASVQHTIYVIYNREFPWSPSCSEYEKTAWIDSKAGEILHADSRIAWEGEYDASKEGTASYGVPCGIVIEKMGLRQLESDGFFYDTDGKLAAFDTKLTQGKGGVVIRKDILDTFLEKTDMKLVWVVKAGKEVHSMASTIEKWSETEAIFTYDGEGISGELNPLRLRG